MLRLFVSAEFPVLVKKEIQGFIEAIREELGTVETNFRWTEEKSTHLTLKFLGAVPEHELSNIIESLEQVISSLRPVQIKFDGLGTFGGKQPRIVWLGISKGKEELVSLADTVETVLNPLGYPRENRPFSPHLTLARLKQNAPPSVPRQFHELFPTFRAPKLPLSDILSIHLMQSHLLPQGSRYESVREFSFSR